MVSVPSPRFLDPLDSELANLYARRAAVEQLIDDLERYASMKNQAKKVPARILPLDGKKAG